MVHGFLYLSFSTYIGCVIIIIICCCCFVVVVVLDWRTPCPRLNIRMYNGLM